MKQHCVGHQGACCIVSFDCIFPGWAHLIDVLQFINDLTDHRVGLLHFDFWVFSLGFNAVANHSESVAVKTKKGWRMRDGCLWLVGVFSLDSFPIFQRKGDWSFVVGLMRKALHEPTTFISTTKRERRKESLKNPQGPEMGRITQATLKSDRTPGWETDWGLCGAEWMCAAMGRR